MSEPQVFRLPDVGEGLTEAEIVAWHVRVGDEVAVNDVLVDVETAKSVVELPSPYAGVVLELYAEPGQELPVGAPLIAIGSAAGEVRADPDPAEAAPPVSVEERPEEPEEPAPAVLVGTGPRAAVARRVHLRRPEEPSFERAPAAGVVPAPVDRRIPVKGVRRATAEAMVRSAFTAPHAAMWTTVDVSPAMRLVRRLRADRAWRDVRVSPLLIVARATAIAVARHPEINASWDDAAQEIVLHGALNLGIAAATPRGLMVPHVKDAGTLSLRELADAIDDLVTRARAGKLAPADMTGGTLTLTNVGSFGVEGATPILNPPEAAILALGAIEQRPWVVDGALDVREVMTLSISIDHRLVDGELGATVLRCVADILSDPARALL
ncbi:dihydrolipoamide acetyltransferase family protein [Nocardioides sp. LHD-245]|uniref:dihydrolipoamide acetyltransferase family protein n=1 Tax=Nocardioides sp. LHD-245 TaxID=3051387 RepID=UPI0027E12FD7|nr:dihydrolipoamide acetyltransferase family protein [Nocardioides sp. LHD-245]